MGSIETEQFGTVQDGTKGSRYTLRNRGGVTARVIEYGAILTELWVPDRQGKPANIVCGFDNLPQYLAGHPYFGATIGRYANRIANARFNINGRQYQLAANNGPNSLHGGLRGFDKKLWSSDPLAPREDASSVQFSLLSPDGEEGYPGNLSASVIYTLTDRNELRLDYTASTDKATVINLTNHSYFNLAGSGDILNHEVTIFANRYTPVNAQLIPTGELAPVEGTPLDFRSSRRIGERIAALAANPGGYDHNYVLDSGGGSLSLAARVREPNSGRVIEVYTTEPGMQLYTGNFLDGKLTGVGGVRYARHSALCLETQHFPDSPNQPSFPSTLLLPGQTFRSTTIYKFSAG